MYNTGIFLHFSIYQRRKKSKNYICIDESQNLEVASLLPKKHKNQIADDLLLQSKNKIQTKAVELLQ
jgi:hypothetical protein